MKRPILFVRNEEELDSTLRGLKQQRCPHCRRTETLNRHDQIHGNDLDAVDKQAKRGRRAWCSNRGQRGGCGQTVAICFSWVLPRHSINAPLLDSLFKHLSDGHSIQVAWEHMHPSVSLESIYHLLQRFRRRIDEVRTLLLRQGTPPSSHHPDPLRQTAEHIRSAFGHESSPTEAFQRTFGRPLMG